MSEQVSDKVNFRARARTRLGALLLLLLPALGLLTTGCARQDAAEATSRRGENVLHLFNWNNYIAPETVSHFEKFCNCQLSQDYYSDNEEMLAKLAAGATGYDLIVPTGNAMDTLIRQAALRPLDKSALPNLRNINPAYLNTVFDPGNKYSVPYAYTLTLIGFNK
jgi:spermidine/putrescine transport system substrate-binding protein